MILGSHNSWTFLKPKKLWMRLTNFVARCQSKDIREQYELYSVRCFDLRIKFIQGIAHVVHNKYDYGTLDSISDDLNYLNTMGASIRVLHDVRTEKDYSDLSKIYFKGICNLLVRKYPNIQFWCGRNLYNWEIDYDFGEEPLYIEKHSSVCSKGIFGIHIPYLWARKHNKEVIESGTDGILLMDFIEIA